MVHVSRCEPPAPGPVRLSREGDLPHAYVLSELEAAGLRPDGLYLWRVLRRLEDWNGHLREMPGVPFVVPDAAYDDAAPAIQPTLRALGRLFREPGPGAATREALALGLTHLALWAEGNGACRTAVALLQGAEGVDPGNPHFAYNVGRVARKLAAYDDAEAWLKRAHFVARRDARWEVATLALSGLGNLHRQRGNLPRARRFHTVAWKMAKRHGLRTLEGDALYDLAVMAFSFDEAELGIRYARQALQAYGPGHGQVYHLAADIAWYWMDSLGNFESAAHVFTALLEYVWKPSARILVLANLGRTASAAGWKEMFEPVWVECWTTINRQVNQEGHAAALIQLARGAGNLGDWDRTSMAAKRALSVARERKENEMVLAAESILAALSAEVISDEAIAEIFRDLRFRRRERSEEVEEFAVELANAMRARRDGAPESPTRALVESGS